MADIDKYSKALEDFVSIIKQIHEERQTNAKIGRYINVFHLWNSFSGLTEPIHSRILQFFLSSNPMHGQGNLFLGLFLKRLGVSIKKNDEWISTAEIGRVDIMLKKFQPYSVIIIENKSNWAEDQPNQLYRYWYENIHKSKEDCDSQYYKEHDEYKIVYLVPDKHKVLSDNSLEKPNDYPQDLPNRLPIEPIIFSFKEELYSWLEDCIKKLPVENTPLINLISQYKEYCKQL